MTPQELDRQTVKVIDSLQRELGAFFSPDQVRAIGHDHYERLRRNATINEFIPLLVYRYTKEDLYYSRRDELHDAA
jgi:hypothetical protein